jgi:hypothetical protein
VLPDFGAALVLLVLRTGLDNGGALRRSRRVADFCVRVTRQFCVLAILLLDEKRGNAEKS